jgi:hypothetical protein
MRRLLRMANAFLGTSAEPVPTGLTMRTPAELLSGS